MNESLRFKDWRRLSLAIDGLCDELLPLEPSRLTISDDTIRAYDSNSRCVAEVKWTGSNAGAGHYWDPQRKTDVTLHVPNLNSF
jgi:hypothetical protein